jgi:hypothetical protein
MNAANAVVGMASRPLSLVQQNLPRNAPFGVDHLQGAGLATTLVLTEEATHCQVVQEGSAIKNLNRESTNFSPAG